MPIQPKIPHLTQEQVAQLRDPDLEEAWTKEKESHLKECEPCLVKVSPHLTQEQVAQLRSGPGSKELERHLRLCLKCSSKVSPSSSERPPSMQAHQRFPAIPGYTFDIEKSPRSGGMGIVYFGTHPLHGPVAVKVMQDPAPKKTQRKRFFREAEISRLLEHENIVTVFDIGEFENQPFFSMEYCDRGSLREFLKSTTLPAKEAATLLLVLASAMEHAHSLGVKHRDLKPANILLETCSDPSKSPFEDGMRLAGLSPKICDFGLAKFAEHSTLTLPGQYLGTPGYMPPEQFKDAKNVTPRADIYSLGAILYWSLTGKIVFEGNSQAEIQAKVLKEEPVPPRRFNRDIPKDLETICLQCLQKDPHRRYISAQALAQDLERFLANKRIRGRRDNLFETCWKWVRRNKVAALIVVVLILISGILYYYNGILYDYNRQLSAAKTEAEQKTKFAQWVSHTLSVRLADEEISKGNLDQAQKYLDSCPETERAWVWHFLSRCAKGNVQYLDGHKANVHTLAKSPNGKWLASGDVQGNVFLWELANFKRLGSFKIKSKLRVHESSINKTGDLLALGDNKDNVYVYKLDRKGAGLGPASLIAQLLAVQAFRATGGSMAIPQTLVATNVTDPNSFLLGAKLAARSQPKFFPSIGGVVRFHPRKNQWLVTTGYLDVTLWDLEPDRPKQLFKHSGKEEIVDGKFTSDGTFLVTRYGHPSCQRWDFGSKRSVDRLHKRAEKGQPVLPPSKVNFRAIGISHDDKWLALAGEGTSGRLFHYAQLAKDAKKLPKTAEPSYLLEGVAQAFCFGPKRKFLGEVQTVDKKGLVAVVKIPDFPTNPKSSKALNLSRVYQARFAEEVPDSCFFFQENKSSLPLVVPVGKRVAIVRWQDPKGLALRTAKLSLDQSIRTVAFHPTSRLVAVGTGSVVKLVDYKNAALPTLQSYTGHDGEIMALAFSSDGKCLVSGSTDGTVRIWPQDAPNAKPSVVDFKSPVLSLAFSPDGTTLALGLANSEIHLLGTQTWQKREKAFFTPIPPNRGDKKQVEREKVVQLAYYSNGNRIVVAGDNGSLLSFNSKLEDRKRITQSGSYFGAKVSTTPDGAEFVIIAGSSVIFQKLEEKEVGYRHPTHAADVIDFAFTPDGKRLVSIGKDNHLTFWNPARIPKTKEGRASKNSQPVAQTDGKVLSFQTKGRPTCVRFDPRGHFLVLGFEDGSLQFWDGTPNNVARQD